MTPFSLFCLCIFLLSATVLRAENADDIPIYNRESFNNGELPADLPCLKEEGKASQIFEAGQIYDLVTCPDGTM